MTTSQHSGGLAASPSEQAHRPDTLLVEPPGTLPDFTPRLSRDSFDDTDAVIETAIALTKGKTTVSQLRRVLRKAGLL